jgi:hypothetical protein
VSVQAQEENSNEFKSNLPACHLDAQGLDSLLSRLEREGELNWQAVLARGCNLLGRKKKTEQEEEVTVSSREELFAVLEEWGQPDRMSLTVDVVNRGALSFVLKNCYPAAGSLVVHGLYREWAEPMHEELMSFFNSISVSGRGILYSKMGFSVVHSFVPLALAFVLVTGLEILLVPYEYRSGEALGWLTAFSILLTLRVAYSFSDYFIGIILRRFPFWEWQG